MHMRIPVYMYMCIYAYMYMCIMYMCTYVQMYMCTYIPLEEDCPVLAFVVHSPDTFSSLHACKYVDPNAMKMSNTHATPVFDVFHLDHFGQRKCKCGQNRNQQTKCDG